MLALLVAAALAGAPVPCPVSAVPDAAVAISSEGRVDLLSPAGTKIATVDTETKLPSSVTVTCTGSKVKLSFLPNPSLLVTNTITLDFGEVIGDFVASDPVEIRTLRAKRAIESGALAEAALALSTLDIADPRVARVWLTLGHAAAAEEGLPASDIAVRALAAPGWGSAESRAIRLHHAHALAADGQADAALAEFAALVEAEPETLDARLALAHLQWTTGDLDAAEASYLATVPMLPLDAVPPEVLARCKPCAKALKKRQ